MGIGSDLLFARLLYARDAGACEAISEISERNAASRAVAERAGMRVAGTVFLYPPASGGAGAGGTGPFAGGTPTSA